MSGEASGASGQPLLNFDAPDQDAFVISDCNRRVVAVLSDAENWPNRTMALIGAAQSGKSRLCRRWAQERGGACFPAKDFDGLTLERLPALQERPLAIDDADTMENEEALLSVLNAAQRGGASVLMSGRVHPSLWEVRSLDLASRLKATPIVELGAPDDEMMRARLNASARRAYMRLPDELVSFLLLRVDRSYEAIEAFMARFNEAVGAQNRPPTIPLARQVLAEDGSFDYSPSKDERGDDS